MDCAELDRDIANIRKRLDYQRFLTPVNYNEENQKFLERYSEGDRYNPCYAYEAFTPSEDEFAFQNLEVPEAYTLRGEDQILARTANSLRDEIRMYEAIGDDGSFTALSESVYGTPCKKYEHAAHEALSSLSGGNETDSGAQVSPEKLRELMRKRLAAYGFDWKVEILQNMASRISVEPDEHAIYINGRKEFSSNDAKRLQVHEIDTHVLRAENGAKRKYEIFSSGTANSLMWEEGLALYNESMNQLSDSYSLALYAARFLCCLHIDESFYELFDMLIGEGCSSDLAIYVVARIKRGLRDTAKPGGFIKDYVYFQGLLETKAALKADPSLYAKLYYGSISLDDVALLSDEISEAEAQGGVMLPLFLHTS